MPGFLPLWRDAWQSRAMKSTMQESPLLISRILLSGTLLHADQEVVTWTADGPRRTSYAEVGTQSAQLANALRGLGIDGDQRVATFMWNNAEHLVAYLAVPSMGAVLQALNIRLFPEQIVYVTNHAASPVSYTHLRAHETVLDLVCRLLLEK